MTNLTKEQFFKLPTNRKTVELLESIVRKQFRSEDLSVKVEWFYAEAAQTFKEWINTKKTLRSAEMPTTEKYYNKVLRIKSLGYAKLTDLPF